MSSTVNNLFNELHSTLILPSVEAMLTSPGYRTILKQNFEQRIRKNPYYSLRAFARDLKIAPSQLSGVLRGKLGLSTQSARVAGKALGMTQKEVETFVDLVASQHARSLAGRKMAQARVRGSRKKFALSKLALDQFNFVSDWYHLALIEASYLQNFKPDLLWLAAKLKLKASVVAEALGRLQRLGLIKVSDHTWLATEDFSEVEGEVASASIRNFHRQLWQKAEISLLHDSLENRDFRSTVMAIRKDKLPEAKLALKKFHEEFCRQIGENEKFKYCKDEVFCLSTAFFALTEAIDK